jgi:hypothetical protein
MPSLSLNIGLNNGRKLPFGGGAAPSGLVVATTNAVNISGNNGVVPDGTYTKVTANGTRVAGSAISDKLFLDTGVVYLKEAGYNDANFPFAPYGHILVPPNTTFTATFFSPLESSSNWRAGKVYGLSSEDGSSFVFPLENFNLSTDPTIIPTSDWNFSITITALSGIPISTATITVLTVGGTSAARVGDYNKGSDIEWWGGSDYYLKYDGTWYFENQDTNSYSYHPTGTNPNFIPDTGWNDGITIAAA